MSEDPSGGEQRPLLPPRRDDDEVVTGPRTATQRVAVLTCCLAMLLAVEVGGSLSSTALMQIEEGIICRQHHPDVDRPSADPRCKGADVQVAFAMLQGWEITFALIPGLLTSLPYGMAADKYGRRIILALSLLGLLLMQAADIVICYYPDVFPLRLVWLAAFFTVVGGGPFVIIVALTAIANDVSTEEQRHPRIGATLTSTFRSTTFFLVGAAAIGGQLVASPLTYLAMERDVWLSVFLGFGVLCLALLITLAMPETRGSKKTAVEEHEQDADVCAQDPDTKGSLALHWLRSRLSAASRELKISCKVLFWDNKSLGLLLGSFVFTTLGGYATAILMQYAAKRFGWSWSQAGLLLSVKAFASLIVFAIVLPVVNQLLAKATSLTPMAKDLWLARGSILLLVVGSFGIGLAPTSLAMVANLVVYSAGSGYGAAVRSLLTAAVRGEHTGMLYAMMGLLENVGSLVAGPLLAYTFRIGLDWGGVWVGLPFIGAGLLLSLAAVIVFSVGAGDLANASLNDDSDDFEQPVF